MIIKVGNNIRIKNPNQSMMKQIWADLVIDNPVYIQNERLGYKNYNVPRLLTFYITDGLDVIVPFGYFREIWKLHPFKDDYENDFTTMTAVEYQSGIILYDYQKIALRDVLGAKNGILVMPAGSGKTQTALEVICQLGMKTLWITHTVDLLKQSMNRAKDNIKGMGVGTITNGKINIGTHITFATVQSLNRIDLTQYKDTWGVIIIDECHRVCGTPSSAGMFYKVIDKLSARHKIGLTATPERSAKGTEKAMFGLIGPVICEIDKSVVKTTKASIVKINTKFELDDDCTKGDGTLDYVQMINSMVYNDDRNYVILKELSGCKDHFNLVLSDRVWHLRELQKQLGQGIVIDGKMVSKEKRKERVDALQLMRDGEVRYIFATYQLAKEGLDIPNLDRLFLTTPHKDRITIVQSVGRVERQYKGKVLPLVYDFVDATGIHQNQWKLRKTIYKKNGNLVIDEEQKT